MVHFKSAGRSLLRRRLLSPPAIAFTLALALSGPGAARQGPAPAGANAAVPDPAAAAAVARFVQPRAAHLLGWLSDGSLLIRTRFGHSDQVHRVRAPLGMREQLSFGPGVIAAAARPYAADELALLEPSADGARSALQLENLSTHLVRALTDGSALDGAPLWAHDAHRIAFTRRLPGEGETGVYVLDAAALAASPGDAGNGAAPPAPPAPRLVAGGTGLRWRLFDWSGDDTHLLLGRESAGGSDAEDGGDACCGRASCELFLLDLRSGELQPVMLDAPTGVPVPAPTRRRRARGAQRPAQRTITVRDARFEADGRRILLLTRASGTATGDTAHRAQSASDTEFLRLAELDPDSGALTDLSDDSAYDVERFAQSADGHYLAYTLDVDGASRLMLIDRERRIDSVLGEVPPGIVDELAFDPQGRQLALSVESVQSPADVYVLDPAAHRLTRWTHSEPGPVDVGTYVTPVPMRFPTWDRQDGQPRLLSALVYGPAAADAASVPAGGTGARPVVILLCGGARPECRPRFDPFLQYLVLRLGAVVIAPNVRGSGGRGATFEGLGAGDLRADAARDVGALLVWIGLQPALDRTRVALVGEGYGAYLALQSLAQYGDRLVGAVAARPPRLSPLAPLLAIRRPALFAQGPADPAPAAAELQQLRARLSLDGVRVDSVDASDRRTYYTAAADFLARVLR